METRDATVADDLSDFMMLLIGLGILSVPALLGYEAYCWLRYGDAPMLSLADFGLHFTGSWVGLAELGNKLAAVPLFIVVPLIIFLAAQLWDQLAHRFES